MSTITYTLNNQGKKNVPIMPLSFIDSELESMCHDFRKRGVSVGLQYTCDMPNIPEVMVFDANCSPRELRAKIHELTGYFSPAHYDISEAETDAERIARLVLDEPRPERRARMKRPPVSKATFLTYRIGINPS